MADPTPARPPPQVLGDWRTPEALGGRLPRARLDRASRGASLTVRPAAQTLPNYPRNDALYSCDADSWSAFSNTSGYTFSYPLGSSGLLMWNLLDNNGVQSIEV